MKDLVTDTLIDQIVVTPTRLHTIYLVTREGIRVPPDLQDDTALHTLFIAFSHRSYLRNGVRGMQDRDGAGLDDSDFSYLDDEQVALRKPLGLVEICDPSGCVRVRTEVFERLMIRYYRAIIADVTTTNDPIILQSWWPEFTALIEQLEQRQAAGD